MKLVIIGGHLSPALSVLMSLPKDTDILFIGRKYALEGDSALSLEYKTINALNIPFVGLNTGRLQRKISRYTFSSLLKLPFGIVKSLSTLIQFRPDVVVGFGGYVSIPVVLCAYLLRIPIVIHEQTLEAGFANKLLSLLAAKICISWSSSWGYFPKGKVVFTGNPIRKFSIFDFKFLIKKENRELPVIYVMGGSSGSHAINVLIEGCIKDLLRKFNVIHLTGDSQQFHDFDRLEKLRKSLPPELRERYILEKYIDPSEIGSLLTMAALIISRSGMNTITELVYFEKPSLLIPFPFSQNNEQLKNARFLERLGLGKVLQQNETDSKKLLQTINFMFQNIEKFRIRKKELRNKQSQNAAQNIISVINHVYKAKKETHS